MQGVERVKRKILLLGGSGLVGRAIAAALQDEYQIISTAGHHEPEGGYCLPIDDTAKLWNILERENPDTIISSLRGDFQVQTAFHTALADGLAGTGKRLLYISTANVFDGDLSRPRTEEDPPAPESGYGIFKRDCEAMLQNFLGDRLIIFRLPSVWDKNCPRIQQLKADSQSGTPHRTYANDRVNVVYSRQIGVWAQYVLERNLHGVFHVGTVDMVDYYAFERMVCDALSIKQPEFEITQANPAAFQAVLPSRSEIPDALQMTVRQVLAALGGRPQPSAANRQSAAAACEKPARAGFR